MRLSHLTKLAALASVLLLFCAAALADTPSGASATVFPDRVDDYRARGAVVPPNHPPFAAQAEQFGIVASGVRSYVAPDGASFGVHLVKTRSDSAAYALLRYGWMHPQMEDAEPVNVGTAGVAKPGLIAFFRGANLALVSGPSAGNQEALRSFARSFAATLDEGEGEIPPLVKHLPEWETAQHRASYAVTMRALQEAVGAVQNRQVLEAVSFDGGTEAVTAPYGEARLIIIEYLTPQLAADNDARITQHLQQLSAAGQTGLPLYRREGNYSVFVFDAPDEQTGRQLLESVRYEQLVRWLGDNPRAWQRAERAYVVMMGSVILNTLLGTGVGLLIALGLGAALGTLIFMRRRANISPAAFTDNGGMVCLDIDEIMHGRGGDPSRLIGSGDQR